MENKWSVAFLVLNLVFLAVSGRAVAEPANDVRFEQRVGNGIDAPVEFEDETGVPVKLSNYLGKKPIILSFVYFKCPNLCSLVLNGIVDATQSTGLKPGKDFTLLSVSINSQEKPALALAKKRAYLARLSQVGDENPTWHFLTGSENSIHRLAEDAGFHFRYDPVSQEYAHPSGFLVLTPKGKISRYFFGIRFSPTELKDAIREADQGKTKKTFTEVILNCFHYNPENGKYGKLIGLILQGASLLTVAGILALFIVLREKRVAT